MRSRFCRHGWRLTLYVRVSDVRTSVRKGASPLGPPPMGTSGAAGRPVGRGRGSKGTRMSGCPAPLDGHRSPAAPAHPRGKVDEGRRQEHAVVGRQRPSAHQDARDVPSRPGWRLPLPLGAGAAAWTCSTGSGGLPCGAAPCGARGGARSLPRAGRAGAYRSPGRWVSPFVGAQCSRGFKGAEPLSRCKTEARGVRSGPRTWAGTRW